MGRWTAKRLTEAGADLHLAVRDPEAARDIFTEYQIRGAVHRVDLRDADAVHSLYQRARPHITFNLAGYGVDRSERDPALSQAVNVDLLELICTETAAIAAPDWKGLRIVHTGSAPRVRNRGW